MNKIAAGISAATMLTGLGLGTIITTAPASASAIQAASSKPKIKTHTEVPGTAWHDAQAWKTRPGSVFFGGGASYAAPRVRHLHWTSYGQHSAHARGQWWRDNCRPNCLQGGHWVSAGMRFYGVHNHAGPGRYFSNVRVTYGHSTFHLWIDSAGDWNWR
jgi:hypothetical protein